MNEVVTDGQWQEEAEMGDGFVPLSDYREYPVEEMARRAAWFYHEVRRRRSVRRFSDRPVPLAVIENCLRAAGTAPSGANRQPWHFVVVGEPELKKRIRQAAEEQERAFYERRASQEWLDALAPLGTGPQKPFLETAPYLIAVFARRYDLDAQGNKVHNYHVTTSVGIAIGILITALHHAGLGVLTYTPEPMSFLRRLLGRPENERAVMILVVGYPAADARVPVIARKKLDEVVTFVV